VAKVLGLELQQDPVLVAGLEERFKRRGLRMPSINLRQAMVPRGAKVLDNPNGSAPGLLIESGGHIVVLLPGPPREMQPMFDAVIASTLQARAGGERFFRTVIFVAGRSESHVEEAIEPIYAPLAFATPPIETTILAAPGQIEVHLSALSRDPAAAAAALDSARDRIVNALGDAVFTVEGEPLERVAGAMLRTAGWTIAAAESCSGGLLLSRLTDVPGSSAYVLGGVVAYSNEMKTVFAGVPADLIAAHGAVSEPVAEAMASGIRSRTGATIGVGITGIAGPGGGSEQKPVGTVAIAVAGPDGVDVRTMHYTGNRALIKFHSSQTALDMVRRAISRHAAVRRD
jgi:nicotinamide-nucleotide amidase